MQDLVRIAIAEAKGMWRFRWIAMVVAWLICPIGWLAVYGMPDTYESEATVYVDTSSALRPLLSQMTVGSDVLSRVELVTTAMLGRPALERVARDTDLHLRAGTREEMDQLLVTMRQNINILNDARREPNLYSIRYRDEDPVAAQAVVSSLLNTFVEDSLGANRAGTQNAQEFLREELKKLEDDLEAAEAELADFKKQNVGVMPGDGLDYFARLQNAMDQYDQILADLRLAHRRRDALRQQMMGESPTLNIAGSAQTDLDLRIAQNQTKLEDLQIRFTDRHPDVIAVKETLEQLNKQKQEQLDEIASGDGSGIASDNPVFQNIQIELTNVNVEIETLEEQQATQQRRINQARSQIDVLPQVEAELARLNRDYGVKNAQYQSLLQRLEVAELSESAEQSEEVKFRIIDPPIYPDSPVAPNRPVLLAAILIVGLGAGGGFAFLLNLLKPVFQDTTTLRDVTGLPILGVVMCLDTVERRSSRVRQVLLMGAGMAVLFAAFVGALVFHEAGGAFVRSLV